jgi:hypothetical protein
MADSLSWILLLGSTLVTILGVGLGLLAPLVSLLALYLLRRAWKWPDALKPSGECLLWTQPSPTSGEVRPTHPLTTRCLSLTLSSSQGETAFGPPSKRSRPTCISPWPRSEQYLVGGLCRTEAPYVQATHLHPLHRSRCWSGAGLSYVCCAYYTPGGTPNKHIGNCESVTGTTGLGRVLGRGVVGSSQSLIPVSSTFQFE